MDMLVTMATGFSALNVVVLAGLLVLYGKMASKTHAGYTFGLMIFSGLLLFQNSTMVYICGFASGMYNWQMDPFLTALAISEFAGLLVLLKVTL